MPAHVPSMSWSDERPEAWLMRLRPSAAAVPEPVCSPEAVAAARAVAGAGPVDWAIETGHRIAATCAEAMPVFGHGEEAITRLRYGTEPVVLATTTALCAGRQVPAAQEALLPEVRRQVIDFVRRGIPGNEVAAAIRAGHAWLAERFAEACLELAPPAVQAQELVRLGRFLFAFMNPVADAYSRDYAAESESWANTAQLARESTVRQLLAGGVVDLAEATRTLGYEPAHRAHLAVVLRHHDPAIAVSPQVTAERLLGALGATDVLVVRGDNECTWAWGSAAALNEPDEHRARLADLLPRGAEAAFGRVGRHLAGWRESHRQALEAYSTGTVGPVRTHRSSNLLALLSVDPDLAERFVRDELGELSGPEPNLRTLRRTLRVYLLSGRSPKAAADELYVARNTIKYRVKRAQDLLPPGHENRVLEVLAALLLTERSR